MVRSGSLQTSWVGRILLLLSSLLLAAGLCEGALRTSWDPQRALWLAADERWWLDAWLARRRSHPGTTDVALGEPVVHSPTLGWRPSPGMRGEGFSTNSRGVRGAREHPYDKAPDERRIVVVGDSYTFANRYLHRSGGRALYRPIPDEDVYTSKLERALPGVTVINLGVPGYGTDQQLLYLREEGFKYGPDLVIAAVYVQDLLRAQLSFRDYAKPFFEIDDGRIVLRGVPVPEPAEMEHAEQPVAPRSYLLTLARSVARETAFRVAPLGRLAVDELNEAIFDSMREDVRRHGTRLLVVVIPMDDYDETQHRSERFLIAWGRRTGTAVLPLRRAFSAVSSEERRNLFSHHWTPLGHHVAAAAIHDAILREGLLGGG